MNRYDYRENMKNDIGEWLTEEIANGKYAFVDVIENREELESEWYEQLWVVDSVTGNASGSYTFNRYEAEENICHNLDLAREAYTEFGYDGIVDDEAERIDVTIRCYLLGECLNDVLDEVIEELEETVMNGFKEEIGLQISNLFTYGELTEEEAKDDIEATYERAVDCLAINTELFNEENWQFEDEIRHEILTAIKDYAQIA